MAAAKDSAARPLATFGEGVDHRPHTEMEFNFQHECAVHFSAHFLKLHETRRCDTKDKDALKQRLNDS